MKAPLDKHEILLQAQQMCQQAVWVQQEAVMTCTHVRLTVLRPWIPGATAMTCEITAVILTQRGLLDSA